MDQKETNHIKVALTRRVIKQLRFMSEQQKPTKQKLKKKKELM